MDRPRLHLIAPAGACASFLKLLGIESRDALLDRVSRDTGACFEVTACDAILANEEDERAGGRCDDTIRAADIQHSLADDRVAAVIAIRGGAWFTRILRHIDFSVMDARRRRLAVFGFSELTSLINIVGARRQGLGVYDMGPAFLAYGLRRYAWLHPDDASVDGTVPREWMRRRLSDEFTSYLGRVTAITLGRSRPQPVVARLVHGPLPDRFEASFVGGNLTVMSMLIGTPFAHCVDPAGRWLLLEDFNDKPERIDRFLAHLTLAGYWRRCAGLLLGDFHREDDDMLQAVLAMLRYHVDRADRLPILAADTVGHIWPMTPFPLHTRATVQQVDDSSWSIAFNEGLDGDRSSRSTQPQGGGRPRQAT